MSDAATLEGAVVERHGLILLNPVVIERGAHFEHVDTFLGYGACGFTLASALALLRGRRAGLLRPNAKNHGLQRTIEAAADLHAETVGVVHADPLSTDAAEALRGIKCVEIHATRTEVIERWPEGFRLPLPAQTVACRPEELVTHASDAGFVLSSGLRRNTYVDVFTTLLDVAVALSYVRESGVRVDEYDSIVGMANGGIFLATLMALIAGKRPMIMDHRKEDDTLVPPVVQLGRTLLVDETVGSGDYFRMAARKLSALATAFDYMVAVRFKHRPSYEFPLMSGALV